MNGGRWRSVLSENIKKQLRKAERDAQKEGHRTNLCVHLDRAKLPHPASEFIFHETRKWRIDFIWWFCNIHTRHEIKIALEVEGGAYSSKTGHRSIRGFIGNIFKYNQMAIHGWLLLRVIPEQISLQSTEGIDWIKTMLEPHWNDNKIDEEALPLGD